MRKKKKVFRMDYEKLIEDVFIQGHSRYFNLWTEQAAITFLKKNAIIIEKQDITALDNTIKEVPSTIRPPQESLKFLTTLLFKERGIELVGFERKIAYGRVDVLGKQGNKTILVECGPCRIQKCFDYLREDNKELWVVTTELQHKDIATLFIIRRGPAWNQIIKKYDTMFLKEIKKVKSPLDSLRGL